MACLLRKVHGANPCRKVCTKMALRWWSCGHVELWTLPVALDDATNKPLIFFKSKSPSSASPTFVVSADREWPGV